MFYGCMFTITWGTLLKVRSIRDVENYCPRVRDPHVENLWPASSMKCLHPCFCLQSTVHEALGMWVVVKGGGGDSAVIFSKDCLADIQVLKGEVPISLHPSLLHALLATSPRPPPFFFLLKCLFNESIVLSFCGSLSLPGSLSLSLSSQTLPGPQTTLGPIIQFSTQFYFIKFPIFLYY